MDREHILFFGEDWGRHPSTAQYLARELCRTERVTWVNSIGLREPSPSLADLGRVIGKVRRALGPRTGEATTGDCAASDPAAAEPHALVSPWILPWHRHGAIRSLNRALMRRRLLAQVEPGEVVVVSANPASYYLHDLVSPRASVYYCADKYAQIAGLDARLVERLEREMLARVDLVIATSRALVDDLARLHDNVAYLPHGVNVRLFARTLECRRSTSTPSVGFIGLLGEHIDLNLLTNLADALPDGLVQCAGPIEAGIVPPRHPRIQYLGALPQTELPGMLANTDVCILPYAMSERNHYANPTKVREYLAAGRTVIATEQPGIADIEGDVRVARSASEFVALTLAALDEAQAFGTGQRTAMAASMTGHDWAGRAATFKELLTQNLTRV